MTWPSGSDAMPGIDRRAALGALAALGLAGLSRADGEPPAPPPDGAEALAAALADTEFAIRAEGATNRLLSRWRWLHAVLGALVYLVLLLHIAAAIYFGLRWL